MADEAKVEPSMEAPLVELTRTYPARTAVQMLEGTLCRATPVGFSLWCDNAARCMRTRPCQGSG